jgi:hypothetical protein
MTDYKRYIIFRRGDAGFLIGWQLYYQSDDWGETSKVFLAAKRDGKEVMIVEICHKAIAGACSVPVGGGLINLDTSFIPIDQEGHAMFEGGAVAPRKEGSQKQDICAEKKTEEAVIELYHLIDNATGKQMPGTCNRVVDAIIDAVLERMKK